MQPTYDELFNEYNEIQSEFEKVMEECISLKRQNITLKLQVENLTSNNLICDDCLNLEKKNLYLTRTLEKFTKGSEMLNVILKAQRFTNDRSGIGYNPIFDKQKGKKKTGGKC